MRLIDIIEICIFFAIMIALIAWGVNTDNEISNEIINALNKNSDNVVIYNICYEFDSLYYCVKDSSYDSND